MRILYKKGKENVVADSLSRQLQVEVDQGKCLAMMEQGISTNVPSWIQEIAKSW